MSIAQHPLFGWGTGFAALLLLPLAVLNGYQQYLVDLIMINVVLAGLPATEGERSPIMPGFSGALTDEQLVELIGYLRSRFSDKPPWSDIAKDVRDARTAARSGTPHTSAVVPADAAP